MSEDTKNSGSRAPLSDRERDIYERLGSDEGWREVMLLRFDDLKGDVRSRFDDVQRAFSELPCRRIEPPFCPTPVRSPTASGAKTGTAYRAITQADLDQTARMAVMQAKETAEEAAEETVDRTLETRIRNLEQQRSAQRRESVKGWLELVKIAAAIIATLGVTSVVKCNTASPAAQSARIHYQQPHNQLQDASVFTKAR